MPHVETRDESALPVPLAMGRCAMAPHADCAAQRAGAARVHLEDDVLAATPYTAVRACIVTSVIARALTSSPHNDHKKYGEHNTTRASMDKLRR